MKCEDLIKALELHLEGDEADERCAAFVEHLSGCERCRVVVDTIKNTITLFRETDEAVEMPESCRERLGKALLEKWSGQKRG